MGSIESKTAEVSGEISGEISGEVPRAIRILGRGRVGRGLLAALSAGLPESSEVLLLPGRDLSETSGVALGNAGVVILAIPDPAIGTVSRILSGILPHSSTILHCAGRRGAEAIELGGRSDLDAGVMHPLVSFADPERPPPLAGTSFLIDGSEKARRVATALTRAAGAEALEASVHGPAYHAAAVLSANAGAALAGLAARVIEREGLPRRDAERALAGLLRSVAANIETIGLPEALTGPVVRGDHRAVLAHRRALAAVDPAAAAAYAALGPAILDCALRAGLDPARAEAIEEALAAPIGPEEEP